MRIELAVGEVPSDADIVLMECESVEDFEDELRDWLSSSDDRCVVDMRAGAGMRFTVPEAVRAVVDVTEELEDDRVIVCFVASEMAQRTAARQLPGGSRAPRIARVGRFEIRVVTGDITRTTADAIVNASNVRLELGSGVSGAIRQAAADPEGLQAAMRAKAPIMPGDVVATPSFGLPRTPTILHAATASGGAEAVARATARCLQLADALELRTLAIPALGTGTGGLPVAVFGERLKEAVAARADTGGTLRRVFCVLHDGADADAAADVLGACVAPAGWRPGAQGAPPPDNPPNRRR